MLCSLDMKNTDIIFRCHHLCIEYSFLDPGKNLVLFAVTVLLNILICFDILAEHGERARFIAGVNFLISSCWCRKRESVIGKLCADVLICLDSIHGRMDSQAECYLLNSFGKENMQIFRLLSRNGLKERKRK